MEFDIEDEELKEKRKKKQKKNNMTLYLAIMFFVLAIILIIVYFATMKKVPTTPSAPVPINTIPKEETKEVSIIDENSNERPLAIMIDTNIGNAKHAGLQDSYINYEMIVEGGLTRIMAIYKDKQVGIVGPVRSARHYFLDYALEHDAVYAHFGWSPYAEQNIKSLNVKNINGMTDTEPFMRDRELPSPHNVFTSTMKLRNYLENKKYDSTSISWKVFNYSAKEINLNDFENTTSLKAATKVSMTYSYAENRSYSYDSVNKYYLRSKNGSAHIDRKTNEQLHYKNIIIMKVENKTIDSAGRQDLTTTGIGEGYYITNGYSLPIRWSKTSRTAKTVLTYLDGTEVIFNDGNTFIQIVPTNSEIVIE